MPKTTKKDFQVFKRAVEKWVDVFGMYEWELVVEHKKIEDGSLATCQADQEAMNATIKFNRDLPYDLNNDEIRYTAMHEVLELVLWNVTGFAPEAYPKWVVAKETHTVIQKIINAVRMGRLVVR